MLAGVLLILAAAVAVPVTAVAPPPAQGPPGVQGNPPRDAVTPRPSASGVIRGRVVDRETGRPLPRARITVSAPELGGDDRTTSTNAEGRYELINLPAGRYSLSVMRDGYLPMPDVRRRTSLPAHPLQLLDRQALDDIDFRLARMSMIMGHVADETGEPIDGVQVLALRAFDVAGHWHLLPGGGGFTNHTGQYRIVGLGPGTYVLVAIVHSTWTAMEHEEVVGYAPTYFPGTNRLTDARRLTLGVGKESIGQDFSLLLGKTARVSGSAFDSHGRPLITWAIHEEYRTAGSMLVFNSGGSRVAPDGSFRTEPLPPGEYTLTGAGREESVSVPLVLDGTDIENVSLVATAGWTISGKVTTESGAPPPIQPAKVRLSVDTRAADVFFIAGGASGPRVLLRNDWTFSATGVQEPTRVRVTPPEGWALRAIMQGNRDITDDVIEMKGGEELSGVRVILTDRLTSVTGQITGADNAPSADGSALIFSTDARKWFPESRFVRTARPDRLGRYQIDGLPPGDYLAIALDGGAEDLYGDPDYLQSIRDRALKFTLGDGESRTLSLTVAGS